MADLNQTSFVGGELDPEIIARTDLQRRLVSLDKCRNSFVKAQGGVYNRAGLRFVGEVADSASTTRIITFEFNTEQQYVLEFSDELLRVVQNGGIVVDPAQSVEGITTATPAVVTITGHGYTTGDRVILDAVEGMPELNNRVYNITVLTPDTFSLQDIWGNDVTSTGTYVSGGSLARLYEEVSPYDQADLFRLKFTQSADVMTLCHPEYPVTDLSRIDVTDWQFEEVTFEPELPFPRNLSASSGGGSGTTYKYAVVAVSGETGELSLSATAPFVTITNITDGNPVQVTAPGHGLADYDRVHIEGCVSATYLNGRRFVVVNVAGDNFELRDIDGTGKPTDTTGSVAAAHASINAGSTPNGTITVDDAPGADSYDFYRFTNGVYGYIGTSPSPSFKDNNIEPASDDTPPRQSLPFIEDYPSVVEYYSQRKTYAATNEELQRFWMSVSGSFNNFTRSSPGKPNDSLSRVLAARKVNEIRGLIALQDLIVLTSGAEWRLRSSDGAGTALTDESIEIVPQSYYGSSHLRPLVVGNTVVFNQFQGSRVRDLLYTFETDGYSGNDLSLPALHFLRFHTIVDWAYAEVPWNIIWMVRDDGKLLGLTYLRDQQVWGWHLHETDGWFESVCVVEEDGVDTPYFVVRREVNGQTKRYIETMVDRDYDEDEDAFFVDSGVTYDVPITVSSVFVDGVNPVVINTETDHGILEDGIVDLSKFVDEDGQPVEEFNQDGWIAKNIAATKFDLHRSNGDPELGGAWAETAVSGICRAAYTVFRGFDHLEGMALAVLANGDVPEERPVVTNGTITLQDPASRVHAGLPYTSIANQLDIDYAPQGGMTAINDRKRVIQTGIRLHRSRGLQVGPDAERLVELAPDIAEQYTGVLRKTIAPRWDKQIGVYVKQEFPLPMGILSISPEVQHGD